MIMSRQEGAVMHAECLEVSSALLRWSRGQPRPIAIKAELLAAALELLAERPHSVSAAYLSFPKIISGRNGGAVRAEK
jgi:hypothetical protein